MKKAVLLGGLGVLCLTLAFPIRAQNGVTGAISNTFSEIGDFFGDIFGGEDDPVRSVVLHADLSPLNENPALTDRDASGSMTVRIRANQNEDGEITEAFVVFDGTVNGQGETITAYHIHRGRPGQNGPVVIGGQLSGNLPVNTGTPARLNSSVMINDDARLEAIKNILDNPTNYYVNVHSSSQPGGLIRGQLRESEVAATRRLERQVVLGLHTFDQDLVDIKRLIVLMAAKDGLVNPQERDRILNDLRSRQERINQRNDALGLNDDDDD